MDKQDLEDLRSVLDGRGAAARDALIELRRHLHAHPELSNREAATEDSWGGEFCSVFPRVLSIIRASGGVA